eukprot:GHVQ01023794.1.p1 GENE.GHVQ01023794.1~~GHVQ01023794.1.p1  ORF type:complete len:334 (+),score=37.02 GHVQ01023794.1:272-1273(+)
MSFYDFADKLQTILLCTGVQFCEQHAMPVSPGLLLRQLIQQNGCLPVPGAFNGLVGRLVKQAGFDAVYVSGAAVSAAQGLPDVGVVGLECFCRIITEITTVTALPCIADADTGFGELSNISRTINEYSRAGAAALHIEDQVFPKRCGHLDGKTLLSVEDMCKKVEVAARARDECASRDGEGLVLCARTDAREVESMESAVNRAARYVDAGADMIFPEGLHSKEEFREFSTAMKKLDTGHAPDGGPLLLANMTEFGKTPMLPLSFFANAGYHVVIYPVSTLRVAMKPVEDMLHCLKEQGTVEPMLGRMFTRQQLYETLKYEPGQHWQFPSVNKS